MADVRAYVNVSPFGETLVDDETADAARATLGVDVASAILTDTPSGTNNDYDLGGTDSDQPRRAMIILTPTADTTISGFELSSGGNNAGDEVTIVAFSSSYWIQLLHGSTSSVEANRMFTTTQNSKILWLLDSITFRHNGTNWYEVAGRAALHSAKLLGNANQSIAHQTWTTGTLDTANINYSSIADLANNRVTIKRSGMYLVGASAYFSGPDSSGNYNKIIRVLQNGSLIGSGTHRHVPSNFTDNENSILLVDYLTFGSNITMQVYQSNSTSSSQNVSQKYLTVHELGLPHAP